MEKQEMIKKIFGEIEEAIWRTRSTVPVKIRDSKLIRELNKIKQKYSKEAKK